MEEKFSWNESKRRYELQSGDHIAFANVRRVENVLFIDYVEAPPALRGTGAAGRLMENIIHEVREGGLTVWPICGYASSWIKRHPEAAALLEP